MTVSTHTGWTSHKGYKDIWKAPINNHLSQDKSKTILSLASKEFNALIDTSKFNLYEVSFIDCKDDVCKKISVFNKQMRGTLLRYIVDQNLSDVDSLPRKNKWLYKKCKWYGD